MNDNTEVVLYKKITEHIKKIEYKEAIEKYVKILELNPPNSNKYLRELGELYEKENLFYKAVECYVKLLNSTTLDLSTTGVLTNQIGTCYFNIKQYKLAIHYFKKVILIKEIPDVYTNIGLCYVNMKNYEEAEEYFLKSYKLDYNNVKTTSSLGDIYYYTKKYKKSIEFYEKNLKKDNYVYLYNKSFSYLSDKNFKKGFELYENRLKFNNVNNQTKLKDRLDVPLEYWDGKVTCKRLLIVSEQGLGDNIQYYRFIIELSEKYPNMKITYFCKQELSNVFKPYSDNIEIITNLFIFNYDYKLYIMSLPKILNLTRIVPNEINYINVNEDKLLFWKEQTQHLKKMKVGFTYNGLLSSFIDKNIPLKEFELLCDLDIELICIHRKNEVEKDLDSLSSSFKEKINYFDIDVNVPFEDTIHLLQNLDLLITIDTSIVHLAGVLNVKTWLLLGVSEWRWSDDANKTYWYNSVELIRTNKDEKLSDLLQTVKNKLKYITASNTV